MTPDTGVTRFIGLAILFTLVVPETCANGLLQGARELLISDFRQMWAIHEILGLPRVTYQS